jgi:hypothetical protein
LSNPLATRHRWDANAALATAPPAGFATCMHAEQQFRKLNAAQIQSRFAGMELTDEVHWVTSSSEAARS